jgi:hypothetical protein
VEQKQDRPGPMTYRSLCGISARFEIPGVQRLLKPLGGRGSCRAVEIFVLARAYGISRLGRSLALPLRTTFLAEACKPGLDHFGKLFGYLL